MNGSTLRSARINCPLPGGDSTQITSTADLNGANVLLVRPGVGTGDGSRQRPFTRLQLAVDAAGSGDVIVVADPQGQLGECVRWPAGKQLRIYAGFQTDFASRTPSRFGPASVRPMRRLSPPATI